MRGLWIFASFVAFLAVFGGAAGVATAQQEPPHGPRAPACVMHNGSGTVVSVPPEHTNACRRYGPGAGGLMCRVAAVTVLVSGGVAGTTVTGTGKCGANILQATATSPGGPGAAAAANGGPTAKGNPADCVATIVQPGGGLIDPTLSYDIRCVFIDP